MSGYYLCRTGRAKHPFYIDSIGVRLYSIEELCYYLSHNVYLIDESIINESLCEWLDTQLGLTRLAKLLKRCLEKGEDAVSFTVPIFQECGYLTETELRLYREQLGSIQIEPTDTRRKMKADYLASYGMYMSAVREYEKILDRRGPGRLGIQFYASTLESEAAAYAQMFRFEEAADCLWESYQTFKSKKVYEKYLRILPLFMSERTYTDRLTEIRADRDEARRLKDDTQQLMAEGLDSELARSFDEMTPEQLVEHLKAEYLKIG